MQKVCHTVNILKINLLHTYFQLITEDWSYLLTWRTVQKQGQNKWKRSRMKIIEHLQPLMMKSLRNNQRLDLLGSLRLNQTLKGQILPCLYQVDSHLWKKGNQTNLFVKCFIQECSTHIDYILTCTASGLTWIWGIIRYYLFPLFRFAFSRGLLLSVSEDSDRAL